MNSPWLLDDATWALVVLGHWLSLATSWLWVWFYYVFGGGL